jgi:hypothetical protein
MAGGARPWTAAALALLLCGAARAQMIADVLPPPDMIGLMKATDDAIVEATVVSARLETWRDAKGEHACGYSYEIAVHEVLWGKAAPRETLTARLWFARERELRDLFKETDIAAGATYVFSLKHGAGRPAHAVDGDTSPPGPGEAACLARLSPDEMGASLRLYRESARPGESWSGMPGKGREYVRIPVTREIADTAVFGAFHERFYRKTARPDAQARAFLGDEGIYPPQDTAKAASPDGTWFEDDGRNGGEREYYDRAVSYDVLKRLIRQPER